jgi:hypothetical protein
MNLKIKKFIYLLNDFSNIILKKDRLDLEKKNKRLRYALIVVSIFALILVIINIYLYLNS